MPDSFTRHPPDSMLRLPSRFTDSSAPAEIQSAASGRCGRRIAVAVPVLVLSCFGSTGLPRQQGWRFLRTDPSGTGFPFALSATSARNEQERGSELVRLGNDGSCRRRFLILFVVLFRTAFPSFPIYVSIRPITEYRERDAVLFHFRSNGSHRGRFRFLFIASFSTVFPSFSPYTTPAITGGGQGQNAVLSMFRWDGFRFRGSHCNSGKRAALAGFREGGRAGKPVPRLSSFADSTPSDQKGRNENEYIQLKNRPSDRRHAYF